MQQTLESLFAQDYANQNKQLEDAVVLCMAMAYLGTPGQFQKLRTYLTEPIFLRFPWLTVPGLTCGGLKVIGLSSQRWGSM
ncbi:hypothetical protein PGT21_023021 [Puccinia graminis f. sp. tritici]|uniref:Uncharacterized protein n=1 Tax=Puccinia graminis f. sp. tritici TaxID=56615 RepID=A0A5B0NP43_PUCGR|nr:hypothetical protein PGT21_023021 [Puccinia graminis f. sp. tritici]